MQYASAKPSPAWGMVLASVRLLSVRRLRKRIQDREKTCPESAVIFRSQKRTHEMGTHYGCPIRRFKKWDRNTAPLLETRLSSIPSPVSELFLGRCPPVFPGGGPASQPDPTANQNSISTNDKVVRFTATEPEDMTQTVPARRTFTRVSETGTLRLETKDQQTHRIQSWIQSWIQPRNHACITRATRAVRVSLNSRITHNHAGHRGLAGLSRC